VEFLGLVVPHVCRLLVGIDQRWLSPFSALGGACLLIAADVAGRIAARPAHRSSSGSYAASTCGNSDDGFHLAADTGCQSPTPTAPLPKRDLHSGVLVMPLFAVSLTIGQTVTPPGDVIRVLLGDQIARASSTVGQLRLSRSVMAVLAGLSSDLAPSPSS
jgi:ABC-type Fe3+-siderophore transport system permease subunit